MATTAHARSQPTKVIQILPQQPETLEPFHLMAPLLKRLQNQEGTAITGEGCMGLCSCCQTHTRVTRWSATAGSPLLIWKCTGRTTPLLQATLSRATSTTAKVSRW